MCVIDNTELSNGESFSSLRPSLDKKVILPMFQLDALVLLRANVAKSWGTSIYSYVEACQCMVMLIAHIGHTHWLSNLQCSRVDAAHMGSISDLLVVTW